MRVKLAGARVAGIASAVPRLKTELTSFAEQWGRKEVDQIIAGTGISAIRQARPGMTTADLCAHAAENLLEQLAVDRASVDGVVFVSQTPDYILPATSALLQNRLGLGTHVAAFDIHYGCSGYVYGLLQAHMLIHCGLCRSVLVCAGDVSTSLIHPQDRALRMLFGDAGSATLVVAGEGEQGFAVSTDGAGASSLMIPAGGARQPRDETTAVAHEAEDGNVRSLENLSMDGIAILMFALREVPQRLDEVLALMGWAKDQIGVFALHQANQFMTEYLAKKLRVDPIRVPFASSDIGNTGPASIPVLLAREGKRLAQEGNLDKVALCGFGVGLSVAAMTLSLRDTKILDLLELD